MRNYQHVLGDAEIRSALRAHLEEHCTGCPETRFIEELGLCRGQVRIDLAALNGVLHGYEIKSDRDRLSRLTVQVNFYCRVLDRATIVVGQRHLHDALDLVPPWWGVLHVYGASEKVRFDTVRWPGDNPEKDPRALVELLWRDDALALLEARDVARGVRGKPRRMVWDRVCEHFDLDEIAAAVRECLKSRAGSPVRR